MIIDKDILSIIGIAITVVVGVGQFCISKRMKDFEIRQDNRDERRRQDEVYAAATKFIQKYSNSGYESDIFLLPYCVTAYKYNPIYPYRRDIYREFCSLTEEVQNEILKRRKLNLKSNKITNYYKNLLDIVLDTIKINYPGNRDIFYEGGKYFHRALLNSGTKPIPEIRCDLDSDTLCSGKTPDMSYETYIANMLVYHKDENPIDKLFSKKTSIGYPNSADEILISYLCCQVAKHVLIRSDDEDIVCCNDYTGKRYMEDLFLEALYMIDNYKSNK